MNLIIAHISYLRIKQAIQDIAWEACDLYEHINVCHQAHYSTLTFSVYKPNRSPSIEEITICREGVHFLVDNDLEIEEYEAVIETLLERLKNDQD